MNWIKSTSETTKLGAKTFFAIYFFRQGSNKGRNIFMNVMSTLNLIREVCLLRWVFFVYIFLDPPPLPGVS